MQAEAERQRRIPQETVERLDETGVYGVAMPGRFGGADFSARELFAIYEALGRGCGATAWTLWASTGGNMWSAAFADEVIRPVYDAPWIGNRTCAVGGSTRRLSGTARKVDGGWMIKGAWPFATASAHASHAYLAVYYDDTDDTKIGMVLLPKESFVLRDDWDAMGMAATGSATIAIEQELFVPDAHFSTPQALIERLAELKAQGVGLRPGGLGRSIMVGTGNAVGMAEHALELFLDGIGKKAIAYSPYPRQQDAPVTHLNVGYVRMQINAARLVAEAALDRLDRLYADGADATDDDLARFHADAAYVWDNCATAIEALFKASGASGIAKKQPLQLVARNCRAGSMHAVHNIQTCMENFGRHLCGIEAAISTGVLERAG
ncbi:acyl-CoA dehydrogenase family protein [Sphingomonas sp. MG17]|uniref:Acyl-CoA dehydrogenase family protein n=1 Tax=Sphingomonas tagetis TaxID=2949092 RepID=A0A9X2KKU3_9SPHN|nr:acyl-CoA dehydrogenase family protein [Sphingomonas tagetis]MCP3729987.1 acyl-CoA dehydrogenase family protein [Sphingomonas tagetis]